MAKKDGKHSKLTINGRMLIQARLCDNGTEVAAFYGIGGAFLEVLGGSGR